MPICVEGAGAARMKIVSILLLIVLILGIYSTHRSVRTSKSERERQFTIRTSAFMWVVGLGFLAAFLFLPVRPAIFLLVPAFVAAVSLGKLWRNGRARFRRESELRVNFERMKRVN